jgi:dTDP-4-dehydrorhamnose 3,5-epimerase
VARGEVFDVAVDIDPRSPTFGVWAAATLSDQNHHQMWIPPGYAHGFVVLSEVADFEYKCTDYYRPDDEIGIRWNDPDVRIDWPIEDPRLSAKDAQLPTLAHLSAGR